ncbi:MAG: hypothetical protein QOH12_2922 [Solirubrobacteraceae bacterium]|jgi:hypothetical protein|nr:hypothetical protein [Solirubrobacteraceae bacterium]
MRWLKQIRIEEDGLNLAADIHAAFAVNRGRSGETNKVESTSHVTVVQDSRSTRPPGEQPPTDPEERR